MLVGESVGGMDTLYIVRSCIIIAIPAHLTIIRIAIRELGNNWSRSSMTIIVVFMESAQRQQYKVTIDENSDALPLGNYAKSTSRNIKNISSRLEAMITKRQQKGKGCLQYG